MGRRVTPYVVLGVLLVVLVFVLAYEFGQGGTPDARPEAAAAAVARDAAPRKSAPPVAMVPDVKLAALRVARDAQPAGSVRNPFRLKPRPAPPPPAPAPSANRAGAVGEGPDQPPPPPPITLKFVGLVSPGGGGKIAVLSGGGDVFYGREGDIIDGRYRILSIGTESVVVAYVDGRGTRRIPLSGS